MNLSRRRFNQLLATACIGASTPIAMAADRSEAQWRIISPPLPSDSPGKIEVLEFFSYGCPHCRSLNPLAKTWAAQLADDIAFRRIPVTFGRQAWANLARLFFSLEIAGELDALDQAVFDAIHEERRKLFTEEQILRWLEERKLDAAALAEVFGSFDVQAKVGRADYLATRYAINAVPTLAVGGRYAVLPDEVHSLPELLEIADGLIVKARATDPRSTGAITGDS